MVDFPCKSFGNKWLHPSLPKAPRIVTRSVSEEYAWISSLTLRVTNNPG
jgi:hypothetical protein